MTKMTLTELANLMKHSKDRSLENVKDDVLKKMPIEISFNSEVIFKVVPKNWRNPMFPIH